MSQTPFAPPHLNKAVLSNKMHSAFLSCLMEVCWTCVQWDTRTKCSHSSFQVSGIMHTDTHVPPQVARLYVFTVNDHHVSI